MKHIYWGSGLAAWPLRQLRRLEKAGVSLEDILDPLELERTLRIQSTYDRSLRMLRMQVRQEIKSPW